MGEHGFLLHLLMNYSNSFIVAILEIIPRSLFVALLATTISNSCGREWRREKDWKWKWVLIANTNRFLLVSQSLWLLWFEQHLL